MAMMAGGTRVATSTDVSGQLLLAAGQADRCNGSSRRLRFDVHSKPNKNDKELKEAGSFEAPPKVFPASGVCKLVFNCTNLVHMWVLLESVYDQSLNFFRELTCKPTNVCGKA